MDETSTFQTLRLIAEAMSSIIGCRVEAIESETSDAPTLNIDLVHRYCLPEVDDNGEIVKKPHFEEYVKQYEIRQDGDETRQGGNEINQGDNEANQDDSEIKQSGSETGQGGQGVEAVYSRPFVIPLLLLSIYLLLYHNYIFMFIGFIALAYYFFIRQVDENVQVNPDTFQIFFNFSGESRSIFVAPNSTVLELRQKIQAKLNIDKPLSLSFSSKLLDDRNTLGSYNIKQHSTINVTYKLLGGFVGYYVISKSFLNPKYDMDYTHHHDNGNHKRGYERYYLPIGWKKIALNVDKYGDSKWLGTNQNAWPISYHGTNVDAASHIGVGGYDLSKGKRFAFGKGIYSSPYYTFSEHYAKEFQFNNHTYKVMFQNRVNPADLKKANNNQEWITVKENNIRPYALCYKKIN